MEYSKTNEGKKEKLYEFGSLINFVNKYKNVQASKHLHLYIHNACVYVYLCMSGISGALTNIKEPVVKGIRLETIRDYEF